MKRRILLSLTVFLVLLAMMAAYVGIAAGKDLLAAREILSTSIGDLKPREIEAAKQHLLHAGAHLNSIPGKLLQLLPVARQNLRAADSIVDAGVPTLDAAENVLAVRSRVEEEDLLENGRIKTSLIESLTAPLSEQISTLDRLQTQLNTHVSGWLLPAVWEAIQEFRSRVVTLRHVASTARDASDIAGPMLGMEGKRNYLVILINNSELRGAGGILSGLGTMGFINGRLTLGKFYYYADLAPETVKSVPGPPDFVRRFGRYRANTTVWVNTTASPDVPEVATAAANLFELTTHTRTDGAILIDPQGIAALMPPDETVTVPRSGRTISRAELPRYIYSDSYDELGGGEQRRRKALLQLGEAVFSEALGGGLNFENLRSVGDAIAGQHIRIVSFQDDEQKVLKEAGVTGDIATEAEDNVLVTIQNFGGDKLDYWIRRRLDHKCSIGSTSASCSTEVTLKNDAPDRLPRYVVQKKSSYALYKGYQEIYIPAAARITGVTRDDQVVEFVPEKEDGRRSLGMDVEVRQGESTTTRVTYDLPLAGSYSLSVTPQPLAHDAHIHVELTSPDDWLLTTPDTRTHGRLGIDGRLSGTVHVTARPETVTGLTALWRKLVDFWNEPVGA